MKLLSLPFKPLNRYLKILFLLALFFIVQSIFTVSAARIFPIDRILVIVNNGVITESEFREELAIVRVNLQNRNTPMPEEAILNTQVLERMITDLVQVQYAESTGLVVTDFRIDQAIKSVAVRNNMTVEQMQEALKKDGQSIAKYRADIRKQLLLQLVLDREIASRVDVSDAEVEQFLKGQEKLGGIDAEYELAHILVTVPDSVSDDEIEVARHRIEEAAAKLRGGVSFPEVAAVYSVAPDALDGGYLGWRKAGQMPGLFLETVQQMNPNEVSEILRSPNGFHLLRLIDRKGGEKAVITQSRVRHIMLRPSELISEEAIRRRLQTLKTRIENGEDFETLALAYSEDSVSRADGGDLGWLNPGEFIVEVERAIRGATLNVVYGPIKSPYGYHLVEVLEKRQADASREADRSAARQQIRTRKVDEEYEVWVRNLRGNAYIEYHLDKL